MMSKSSEEEIFQKSIPIASKYFNDYYSTEVVFTDYKILELNAPLIILKGHVKTDETVHVSIEVNYKENTAQDASGPEDFIKKRNPPL
ncbi:hypothetical protein [Paenibacillus polymyxa]|nr:hypothetical protein [Paenibacillus polymyxa]